MYKFKVGDVILNAKAIHAWGGVDDIIIELDLNDYEKVHSIDTTKIGYAYPEGAAPMTPEYSILSFKMRNARIIEMFYRPERRLELRFTKE